jgi:hypothetical protein
MILTVALIPGVAPVFAQGNYEVQVYGSELVPKGATMFEMHSNFTALGSKYLEDGVLPTQHQQHETLEVTHGFNEWFETGFYLFSSLQDSEGWKFVGTHIRPRIAVPSRYHLPVGLSLSTEFGYQRTLYSKDTWTWEIRPIVDKQMGKLYWSVNPTFAKSFHGPSEADGYTFEPNVKFSYSVTKKLAGGLEYYGAMGNWKNPEPLHDQEHMFVPAIDVDFGPRWEFNFGVGLGVTHNTDRLLVKAILGYRLGGHSD